MKQSARKRILFFAEGATMLHFVRPLAIAAALDPSVYDIHFYAPARFSPFLQGRPFTIGELNSMPAEQFLANLARGAPMFSFDVLRRYVDDDRGIISGVRPDLVVGDMRLSLSVSARLEHTPLAILMNAYWSPYTTRRSIIPEIPLTRVIPPRLLQPVYRFSEPLAYAAHVAPINRVRKEFGMPPLPADLRVMYTDGDYVLYPDVPEFVPAANLPKTHRYVGICEWSLPAPRPDWWDRAMAEEKPRVFVSLGSSGPVRALPAVLEALSGLPVAVLLATSGRVLPTAPSTPYVADLLPFTPTAAQSAVVVSHGGSGGLYPAMAAGTPVLAIPSNADQQLSTAVLKDSGAGLGIRVEEASATRLRKALEQLLIEPRYRQSARHWSAVYARYDSGVLFREFLSDVLSTGP